VAGTKANHQKQLRSFLDRCETVGFPIEPFQAKIARLRARSLAQDDIRVRGCLTDARGPNIRMLVWMVPEDVPLTDHQSAKKANPLSLITPRWLKEQREALHEIDYQRFHCNRWVGRIGGWLPARRVAGVRQRCQATGGRRHLGRA
jgi:hypothetical protein